MSDAGNKPLEPIPCGTGRLESNWNLKLTAFKAREVALRDESPFVEMVFTFAFTDDTEDVDAVRQAFQPSTSNRAGGHVAFYLFDEENVILAKPGVFRLEGVEITG